MTAAPWKREIAGLLAAQIELRAAELAADYEPDLADALTDGSDEEAIGWALHRDATTPGRGVVGELHRSAIADGVPRSAAAWAGWLAREIYDSIHDIEYPDRRAR